MRPTKLDRMTEDYGVSRLLADKALHLPVAYDGNGRFRVGSGSEPGVVYHVEVAGADWRGWRCDCIAPGACSHKLAAAAYTATTARRSARGAAVGVGA